MSHRNRLGIQYIWTLMNQSGSSWNLASCNPMSKVLFPPLHFSSYFPSLKSTKTPAFKPVSPLFKTPLMVYKSLARPRITLSKLKANRFLMLLSKLNQIRELIHICLDQGEQKFTRVTCSGTRDKMSMSLSLSLSLALPLSHRIHHLSVVISYTHRHIYQCHGTLR